MSYLAVRWPCASEVQWIIFSGLQYWWGREGVVFFCTLCLGEGLPCWGVQPSHHPYLPSLFWRKGGQGKRSLRGFVGEEQQNRGLHSEDSCEIKLLVGVYAFAMHQWGSALQTASEEGMPKGNSSPGEGWKVVVFLQCRACLKYQIPCLAQCFVGNSSSRKYCTGAGSTAGVYQL